VHLRWGSWFLVGLSLVGLLGVGGCGRGLQNNLSTTTTSSSPVPTAGSPAASSAQPPASGGDISNDNTIAVTAGSDTSGIDIAVSPAAGTENAIALGKASDGFAANTGTTVHLASTNTILLFGPGLSGSMSVIVSGPNDIGISNLRSTQAKDGTPGIAFDAVIGGSSAVGARSVFLKAANNDITAFTGGLEVLP
jgi:hypothetical protein